MDFLELLEHHVLDHVVAPGFTLFGVHLAITKHLIMMWISSGVLVAVLPLAARDWPAVPTGGRALLESFVLYFRDEVVANTGEEGRAYVPYFLTLFFFTVLTSLLGLIPGFSTATGNISVTAALAGCSFVLINIAGIREYGVFGHLRNFIPHGLPVWLVPFLVVLEVVGLFTRAFALAIRLFANMIAGHIVILSFLSMIFIFASIFIAPPAVAMAVALGLLEVFVAFLQAYIITLLSAIYVGAALHPH